MTKISYWLQRDDQLSLHGTCWAGVERLRVAIVVDSEHDQADALAFWDSVKPSR